MVKSATSASRSSNITPISLLRRLVRKCTPKRCLFFIIIFTICLEIIVHIELSKRYYLDKDSGKWRMETKIKITNPINNQVLHHTFTIDWDSEVEAAIEEENNDYGGGGGGHSYLEYSKANKTNPCSVTVLILDPRLPILSREKSLWGSIESTVAHGPENMCILIQTSSCISDALSSTNDYKQKSKIAYNEIYEHAPFPLFREFLQTSGRVRITFLNHTKYHVRSCDNFITPTHAWVNYHYWGDDEFTNGVDSDMIMTIQDDTVLCHDFDIKRWDDVAYVGAPWPNVHKSVRKPSQCDYLSTLWNKWNKNETNNATVTNICQFDKGIGAFGNGGLSLRNRKWMKKAILACPHFKYSGLSSEYIKASNCSINTISFVPEDVYYATILRGINAPLPTSFEASLFSTEIIFPEEIINKEWYAPKNISNILPLVKRRYSKTNVDRFLKFWNAYYSDHGNAEEDEEDHDNKTYESLHHFIPIGLHNIWFYHDKHFLLSLADPIDNHCEHFRHILPIQSFPGNMRLKAFKFGVGFHD